MAQESTMVQVWRFIAGFVQENGLAPSLREIAKGCHLSVASVVRHLDKLEGMGAVELHFGQPRSIKVVEQPLPPHSEHSF